MKKYTLFGVLTVLLSFNMVLAETCNVEVICINSTHMGLRNQTCDIPDYFISLCIDGCEDGNCIDLGKPDFCEETDDVEDYYNKGKTTVQLNGAKTEREDYCSSNKILTEYYCTLNYYDEHTLGDSTYECENGCEDGACINENVATTTTTIQPSTTTKDVEIKSINLGPRYGTFLEEHEGKYYMEAGEDYTIPVEVYYKGTKIGSCQNMANKQKYGVCYEPLRADFQNYEVSSKTTTEFICEYLTQQLEASCKMTAPSESGKWLFYISYNIDGGDLAGGTLVEDVIVYQCGDDFCEDGPEGRHNCCVDCGVGDMQVCENNKAVLTCGNGICESNHGENQEKCCSDCGSPILFKCENNENIRTCGNGVCESQFFENSDNCCNDCDPGFLYVCRNNVKEINSMLVAMIVFVTLIISTILLVLIFKKPKKRIESF